MKPVFRQILIHTISIFLVFLFAYTAASKLIAFSKFSIQLSQSPILNAHAGWLTWAVPLVEIVIASLLCFEKTRFIGLCGAFTLLVAFTIYIVFMLKFSDYVPCSCGGVLENLSWRNHIVFNSVFTLLSFLAIILKPSEMERIQLRNISQ